MRSLSLPVALTMGEPGGIGPDITLASWLRRFDETLPAFYVIADPGLLAARAERLKLQVPIRVCTADEALSVFSNALPVVPLDREISDEPGELRSANGPAVIASIDRAVDDIRQGKAAAVVTNPIHKKALYDAGFDYPGHTEYLGALSARFGIASARPVMLLAGPDLHVVPVTVHIPLKDVPGTLSRELIAETGRIVAADLKKRFGIEAPRLALCGLNPHAGEGGTIGREDMEIIAPAVADLRAEGIDASGPYSADTLFHARARTTYDCALAMYHDQALIPIKTIAFDSAVNVTLGLPFVRTSPDHGTALSLAGTGKARPDSLEAALRLAAALSDPHSVD
ncbi:4-hydroxythreonine-4-phosphate dehydrogenase PdxA [Stappia sp. F7233]|uniref:4-hydroxythreonine-4-phosphate dehydrogenase n=1 Tax=Stappia albiluteola TaxID=2758565 RepID=A0A839ACW7_9HYPH|nr:4-hydroxythreonine-4-phosphate dehydrogenase PdxA [Stappia albiluteola]MBA5776707.1 4-hydroxythreonine-4-phosphate dehydrogenase PdxA [Stappia albiluteola]